MDANGQNTRVLAKLFGGQGTPEREQLVPLTGRSWPFVSYRLK